MKKDIFIQRFELRDIAYTAKYRDLFDRVKSYCIEAAESGRMWAEIPILYCEYKDMFQEVRDIDYYQSTSIEISKVAFASLKLFANLIQQKYAMETSVSLVDNKLILNVKWD